MPFDLVIWMYLKACEKSFSKGHLLEASEEADEEIEAVVI